MGREQVALFKCHAYDTELILSVFKRSLDAIHFDLEGLEGKKVLLKPNMLGAYPPEMGITTHPVFLEAAIILFKEAGCEISVGDSANGIFSIDSVWEKTGIRDVCKKYNVKETVFEKEGGVLTEGILIAKPVLDADIVVNLPRFKTHGLTILTVATKNLYGCVPGLQKTKYHRENIDKMAFAKLLVRIANIVRPSINLVDGIVAMDGNGPSAGRIIKTNFIVVGENYLLVDVVCSKLAGLPPSHLDVLIAAKNMGLWDGSENIEIVGEKLADCIPKDFNLPTTYTKGMRDWWISKFVVDKIWGGISIKPKVDKKKCIHCWLCAGACPSNAIEFVEGEFPKMDYKKCFECYCCHEVCPQRAINLRESLGIKMGRYLGERRIKKRYI